VATAGPACRSVGAAAVMAGPPPKPYFFQDLDLIKIQKVIK
jgi:hypothetical protein